MFSESFFVHGVLFINLLSINPLVAESINNYYIAKFRC